MPLNHVARAAVFQRCQHRAATEPSVMAMAQPVPPVAVLRGHQFAVFMPPLERPDPASPAIAFDLRVMPVDHWPASAAPVASAGDWRNRTVQHSDRRFKLGSAAHGHGDLLGQPVIVAT